jgi:hypothetical protein
MALRALAEEVAGAVHFVPWSKPPYVSQFWLCHVTVSHTPDHIANNVDFQTALLPAMNGICQLQTLTSLPFVRRMEVAL